MTKKKDKEVVEEGVIKEDTKEVPDTPSWEDVKAETNVKDDAIKIGDETLDDKLESAKKGPVPEVTMQVILDTLERLESKFDKTFNNHTLTHGRFIRGRRTLNR